MKRIRKSVSLLAAALMALSVLFLPACTAAAGVTVTILNESNFIADGDKIIAQAVPEASITYMIKRKVEGVSLDGDTVRIDSSVEEGTTFIVVVSAGISRSEKEFTVYHKDGNNNPDDTDPGETDPGDTDPDDTDPGDIDPGDNEPDAVSIIKKDNYIADGEYIRTKSGAGNVTFSLKQNVTGISINSQSGRVSITSAVADRTAFSVVAQNSVSTDEKGFIALKTGGNIFYEGFSNGVSADKWYISNRKWGGAPGNGGCIPENINYTDDGTLIITANGDYYDGEIRGIGNDNGRRTGGAVVTKDILGPGSYEVRMKMLPRIGVCNAIWTYYYENDSVNHEIDIEAPGIYDGESSLENTLFTSWTGLGYGESNTTYKKNTTPNNDGDWHTYRFDWHTNPKRVDWYIDDVLMHSTTNNVPTYHARFWVGVWFPQDWCGDPDFETDYMAVDWIRHTPYSESGSTRVEFNMNGVAASNKYPTAPIAQPVSNLVSNPGFEGMASAWTPSSAVIESGNALSGGKALSVPAMGSAYQIINGVYGGFKLDFSVYVKAVSGSGVVKIEYLGKTNNIISTDSLLFSDATEYTRLSNSLTAPTGCKKIKITLSAGAGSAAYFDNLALRLSV